MPPPSSCTCKGNMQVRNQVRRQLTEASRACRNRSESASQETSQEKKSKKGFEIVILYAVHPTATDRLGAGKRPIGMFPVIHAQERAHPRARRTGWRAVRCNSFSAQLGGNIETCAWRSPVARTHGSSA